MMTKELYLYGNANHIAIVLDYCKKNDLINKGKIWLIDLLPDITEEYAQENRIIRE